MISVTPRGVTEYWVQQVGPEGWYRGDPELDAAIRAKYLDAWEVARQGGMEHWRASGPGALAYLILTDQFPRNMFRDDARAFATDGLARAAAKTGIDRGWDLATPEPERQFFYLPLMHSENAEDQERAVRLCLTRMPRTGASTLLHARAHREVIRRFGRFPYRNAALGRETTGAEQGFLDAGGYGAVVRDLQG